MSWLSLLLFLIMFAIWFFQTIHGAFSAFIMAVVCVLCATLALGVHEMLAEDLLIELIGDYAYAVSFVGLFGLTVLALRLLLDKFISRNPMLPPLVDKLGAAFFGAVTALIATGVMGVGIQMLPIGPVILGFQRYDEDGNRRHGLWLNPDRFTVNLCGYLVDSTLSSGEEPGWRSLHPDFLTELHWLRNTPASGSRIGVGSGCVRPVGLFTTPQLAAYKSSRGGGDGTLTPIEDPPPGRRWLVVSVHIDPQAKDSDGYFRLSPTQVRLVGEAGAGDRLVQFSLRAIGPYDGHLVTADSRSLWGNKTGEFDFVFEVPEDFRYRFIEFKRAGRASLDDPRLAGDSAGLEERAPAPMPEGTAAAGGSGRSTRGAQPSTVPIRPQKRDTHFGNQLPQVIKRYNGNFETGGDGKSLSSGQITLNVDRQEASAADRGRPDPERTPLESLAVPDGLHMLQLNVEAVHAQSALAAPLNLTRRVLQQYRVVDADGENHWPAGLIAACDKNGERIMEIQYFPEGSEIRSQLRPFQRFRYNDLKGDYRFVLLFIVEPETVIVQFDSGGRPVDLSDLNLVAPG